MTRNKNIEDTQQGAVYETSVSGGIGVYVFIKSLLRFDSVFFSCGCLSIFNVKYK